MSQEIGLILEIPLFIMTIGAIALRTAFQENFGEKACSAYSLMFPMSTLWGTVCGFTMAVYRLTCINGKRYNINYFIAVAFSLVIFLLLNAPFTIEPESSPGYQFCIGKKVHVSTVTSNLNESMFQRLFRARVLLIIQGLVLSEFVIYLYMLNEQQKHNKKHLQEKIINKTTFNVRKKKNVITLNGQLCIFTTRMSLSILVVITKILNIQVLEATDVPIILILFPFIITIAQVLSSHEMRRYVKSKFD